ncbi:MAG: J domain-containing protein [Microbacteriaceae bacterium]
MFDSPLSASAYEVLGVAPDADDEALKRAYRLRLRATHPDTGGDAAAFIAVQRAWELVGTAAGRATYDRGHGFGAATGPGGRGGAGGAGAAGGGGAGGGSGGDWSGWRTRGSGPADTRPKARMYGHPGGWRRERYLELMREWAGRGVTLEDPYDPALVRSAPVALRAMLADALAEEATARIVGALGIGYTAWHDVAAGGRRAAGDPNEKLDHIVLGPTGLYGILSEDFGAAVNVRRGELIGEAVRGLTPVADLLGRMRVISRAAKVRFSGAIVVLPDEDLPELVTTLGTVRGTPVVAVGRSALANVLRQGVPGARDIGGNELFDVRTRLQATVAFV